MTYYDDIADGYAELHKKEQLKKAKILFDEIKEYITITPTTTLLDVGCGPGYGNHYFNCDKTGIDPSAKLLASASHKTILGVAEHLPFPNNSFDIVISVTALQNFNDKEKSLQEIRRVGKHIFAISYLKKSGEHTKLIKKHFHVLKKINEDKDNIFICTKTKQSA